LFDLPTNFLESSVLVVFLVTLFQAKNRLLWKNAWSIIPKSVVFLVALFVITSIVSTYISPHPTTSLGILKGWIITPIIFSWLVFSFAIDNTNNFINHAIRSLILSGLIVSLIGIAQIGRLDRITSVYDVPNSLALFITPLIVLSLWLAVHQQNPIFNTLATLVMLIALLATQSASGIFTVIITLLIAALIFPLRHTNFNQRLNTRKIITILFGITIISTLILTSTGRLNYLTKPLLNEQSYNSISVRRQLWSISWELIKENPILGTGLGTFEPAYQNKLHQRFIAYQDLTTNNYKLEKPLPEFVFRDPHNWILSFWLNTGLLGLFSFTALNILILVKTTKHHKHTLVTSYGLLVTIISLLLFGLTDTIYWKNDLSTLYWLLIALSITPSWYLWQIKSYKPTGQ